jgi:hypothetical protein
MAGERGSAEAVGGIAAQSDRPPRKAGTARSTADLPTRDADTLAEVARGSGFNKVTTLVRAVLVLAELTRAASEGGELTTEYPDGRRERLILR